MRGPSGELTVAAACLTYPGRRLATLFGQSEAFAGAAAAPTRKTFIVQYQRGGLFIPQFINVRGTQVSTGGQSIGGGSPNWSFSVQYQGGGQTFMDGEITRPTTLNTGWNNIEGARPLEQNQFYQVTIINFNANARFFNAMIWGTEFL